MKYKQNLSTNCQVLFVFSWTAEIAKDLNLNVSQAALSVAAYMLPFGLFILVYGPPGDKIGNTKILKPAAFATAVFSALGAVVFNLPLLIVIRAINVKIFEILLKKMKIVC